MNIEKINVGGNLYDVCDTNARAMISDEYNSATQYSAGDYCIWENTLKKANKSTTGTFDSTAWDDTNLVEAVGELNQNMNTYDTQTIESFSSNVISSGSVKIEKKNGWCHINGRLVLSDTIADSTQILSGIPKPKNGALNMTVVSTSITFSRALYISISSDGVMSARWGSANTHYIDISYCYIE